MFKAAAYRLTPDQVGTETIRGHLRAIVSLVLSRTKGWEFTRRRASEVWRGQKWESRLDLTARVVQEDADPISAMRLSLEQALREFSGSLTIPYLWSSDQPAPPPVPAEEAIPSSFGEMPTEATEPDPVLLPGEIRISPDLLQRTSGAIEAHPAFRGIYGRGPHIRRGLRAIDSFGRSASLGSDPGGRDLSRSHVLYYGPPAGGKSRILRGIRRLLPKGSYFNLDAPSATKAGVVRLFRETFRGRCPPVVFVEEIEKVALDVLIGWLGLLDERAELSKFTHFKQDSIKVNFLCIATCNDKEHLDTALKGALGSRFGHAVYVPRPDEGEMRMILDDRVRELGGDSRWVEVCLGFMDRFGTDDPREVKSWLDYREGLVDGSAEADLLEIRGRLKADRGLILPPTGDPYADSLAEFQANGELRKLAGGGRGRRRRA